MNEYAATSWDAVGRSRVPPELADFLSESMEMEIARLPHVAQSAFVRRFENRRKTLLGAYMRLPLMSHYGYLGRWGVSAVMFLVTVATLGAAGSVWMAVDFFRMPSLVRGYNRTLAREVLQEVKARSLDAESRLYY